jgi:photosystem II stability/assembly factor-like uncharacterized protein
VVDAVSTRKIYVSLYGWGVMTSADGGANWTAINNGLPELNIMGLAANPGNLNTLYALTQANGVYQSNNGGGNWSALNSGYPAVGATLNSIKLPYRENIPVESPLGPASEGNTIGLTATSMAPGLTAAVSPFSPSMVLLGTAGKGVLWLNGSTWTATNISSGSVYALLFDRSNANRVWLGGDPGDSLAGSLRVSNDQGKNWSAPASGLSGRTVYALSQSAIDPTFLLAGTDSGVFKSTNSGLNWSQVGFNGQAVKAVAVHPAAAGRLLIATAASIYISDDYGANWRKIYSQLDGFDYLGVTVTETGPGYFNFYSRYGGVVRISE